jgi:hyperosmotically inducible periplasmic protein
MASLFRLAAAFAAGAVLMYCFDPQGGRRRRALMRDKGVSAGHDLARFARGKTKRAADHLHGMAARTRARMREDVVDDDRLRERVRARLGRVVAHPRAIEVKVRDGRVVLSGHASRREIDQLVGTVATMRGVGEVDNMLSPPMPGDDMHGGALHQGTLR